LERHLNEDTPIVHWHPSIPADWQEASALPTTSPAGSKEEYLFGPQDDTVYMEDVGANFIGKEVEQPRKKRKIVFQDLQFKIVKTD
jgi:hypothetical protein